MAPTKPALDLNAMIAAGEHCLEDGARLYMTDNFIDRQRRKNVNLAQEIFGKNRRSSAPGAGNVSRVKSGPVPSLASRIGAAGITKVWALHYFSNLRF